MAEIKGVLTTLNHRLPEGVDPTLLAQWRLKDGTDYMTVRNRIANSFDGLNAEILAAWGDLIFITEDDMFEYPNGGTSSEFSDATDLDDGADPKKGETVGHHLPLRRKNDKVAGTKYFFRDAREATINATIARITQAGRNTFERAILTRAMTDNENPIGTSGRDVGFASGSAVVSYTPPDWGGQSFQSTHNHYFGVASASKTLADVLDEIADHLHEHGHEGPYNVYISSANVKTYRALKGFQKPTSDRVFFIDRGGNTDAGPQAFERGTIGGVPNMGGWYIGSYDSGFGEMLLRATARIPSNYAFGYKSYGQLNERNPIAVRIHPQSGFGFRLNEKPSFDSMYPIESMEVEVEYGISCGKDRTAGASAFLVSGGVWVDPSIS